MPERAGWKPALPFSFSRAFPPCVLLENTVATPLKILAYFLATLLLGATLAPLLFWAGHASGSTYLRETDFQRYFDRAILLSALLLLWPAMRALHFSGWRDFELRRDPARWQHLVGGFLLACGLLWLLGGCGIVAGFFRVRWSALTPGALGSIALSAIAVACLEEMFFRGALFGLVRRAASDKMALVFIAALFAILHFLKPPVGVVASEVVTWSSGFVALTRVFWQFGQPALLAAGFTTLFLVGLILGWARWQTGALWAGIGLHAGWIVGLKTFAKITRRNGSDAGWPWFGENLYFGLGPVFTLLITGAIVWLWLRRGIFNTEAEEAEAPRQQR